MQRQRTIMAIGGGSMRTRETRRIEQRLLELTGKSSPRVAVLPTAGGDNPDSIEMYHQVFGGEHKVPVSAVRLFDSRPSPAAIRTQLREADLIYVGGGNTLRMMKQWRRLGVDALLRTAYRRGCVMAGSSAGGICWFSHGHSDSRAYSSEGVAWRYIRVKGLGIIPLLFCPHYHAEQREQDLDMMVARTGVVAVACDNNTAIEIIDTQWRVFRSRRSGKAYRVLKNNGEVVRERLPADHQFRPLEQLTSTTPVFV